MRLSLCAVVASCFLAASLPCFATPVASASGGPYTAFADYEGQSFTVAGSGFFNHVTFNFFSDFASTQPFAAGTGYLFSSAYTGSPDDLSTTTAGLLGIASSANGLYTFAPSLVLQAGMKYFFYEDEDIAFETTGDANYAGGESYYTYDSSGTYDTNSSLNFAVNAQAVPAAVAVTPEPSSLALLGTGLLGLSCVVRKRLRQASTDDTSIR